MSTPYTRRDFLRTLGLGATALSLPRLSAADSAKPKRPNILFIMSDDHAFQAIGAYGSRINKTPNIDRIANEGALFLHNTCCNSICAPSRATILTGKHSHANGKKTNLDTFDASQPTFPKMFQSAGYQTAVIGKWHLKSDPIGFDHWDILPGQGLYYNPDFISAEGRRRIEGYCTDVVTDLAIRWLEQRQPSSKPFLLLCQHKAPHRPWMPGPDHLSLYDDVDIPEPDTLFDDYSGRSSAIRQNEMSIKDHFYPAYDLKLYPPDPDNERDHRHWRNTSYHRMTPAQKARWDAAYEAKNKAFREAKLEGKDLIRWKYQRYIKDYLRCIASVDDNVGRLLDYLDESGLARDTLIVYTSDQGFFLGEHGMYDKRWMYEESLAMPLVVRWPAMVPAGTRISVLTQNIDFAPTFLEAAGLPVPGDMQGRSLLPLMKGQTPEDWRKSIYYHYYEIGEHNVPRHEGVRTERYKLIHFYDADEWELYDLEKDPQEMNSVYDEPGYAAVVREMKAELERLKKQYGVPERQG